MQHQFLPILKMHQTSYHYACRLLLLLQFFSTLTSEHVPGDASHPTAQPTCDQCTNTEAVTLEPATPEAVMEQLLPEVDEHAVPIPLVVHQSSSAAPFEGTLLCYTGNLLPLALDIWALVRRLAERGHQVTCLVPDALAKELPAEDNVSVIHYGSVAFQEYQLDKKGVIHELTATLDFQLASCASVLQVGASQRPSIVTGSLAPNFVPVSFFLSRPSPLSYLTLQTGQLPQRPGFSPHSPCTAPHITGHLTAPPCHTLSPYSACVHMPKAYYACISYRICYTLPATPVACSAAHTTTIANAQNSSCRTQRTMLTTKYLHALLCPPPPSSTSQTSLSSHPFPASAPPPPTAPSNTHHSKPLFPILPHFAPLPRPPEPHDHGPAKPHRLQRLPGPGRRPLPRPAGRQAGRAAAGRVRRRRGGAAAVGHPHGALVEVGPLGDGGFPQCGSGVSSLGLGNRFGWGVRVKREETV